MKSKTRKAERAEELLRIPIGTLTEASRIELSGNRRVLIEGCRGIVRYDEDEIEIRTDSGQIRLSGRELCMTSLNPACAVVTGRLLSLEFVG